MCYRFATVLFLISMVSTGVYADDEVKPGKGMALDGENCADAAHSDAQGQKARL